MVDELKSVVYTPSWTEMAAGRTKSDGEDVARLDSDHTPISYFDPPSTTWPAIPAHIGVSALNVCMLGFFLAVKLDMRRWRVASEDLDSKFC
jgi:hypothetical protein